MPYTTTDKKRFAVGAITALLLAQSSWMLGVHLFANSAYANFSDAAPFTPPLDDTPRNTNRGASGPYNNSILPFRERLNLFVKGIFVPPVRNAAGTAISSRSRNYCPGEYEPPLQVLAPENGHGLTLSSRPSIAIEVLSDRARSIYLTFETESGELHSEQHLPIPIVRKHDIVQFPAATPELMAEQTYHWTLAVACDRSLRPDSPLFRGTITTAARSPEADSILSNATPLEQITWLGAHGYWYDMLPLIFAHPEVLSE